MELRVMPAAVRLKSPRRAWLAAPLPAGLLLAGLLLLAGCGPKSNTFAPYCPAARRLPDAYQLTIYRPGAAGQDITDLVLQGTIIDVSGVCKDGDAKNTVQADTSVTFRFVRGPAMAGRSVTVPYLRSGRLRDAGRLPVQRGYGDFDQRPGSHGLPDHQDDHGGVLHDLGGLPGDARAAGVQPPARAVTQRGQ
jgi:hypothetical protein